MTVGFSETEDESVGEIVLDDDTGVAVIEEVDVCDTLVTSESLSEVVIGGDKVWTEEVEKPPDDSVVREEDEACAPFVAVGDAVDVVEATWTGFTANPEKH